MTRDEIRELAAFQADETKGARAMTFYFQPDLPQDRSHRTQAIVAKDVIKQALKTVTDKGANGWLHADLDRVLEARPGDGDALVAAGEPLMRDPASAAAMGARGRARVLEKFSLDAEANAIAGVYRTLV